MGKNYHSFGVWCPCWHPFSHAQWHRGLVLITVTLLGSAHYPRAVAVPQTSLEDLADGVRHMPEFSTPSPRGEFPRFLETLFPLHQIISGLSGAQLEEITAEL